MAEENAEGEHPVNQDLVHVDAEEVFVLMKKNTRVSRNIRACWFFRHLKSSLTFTPLQELHLEGLTQDLTLASLIPADGEPLLDADQTYNVGINPHTTVTFLASRYRMVFTLDMSPSVMAVDVVRGQLVSEAIFEHFSRCLRALVTPMKLPGSQLVFNPKLFITVIAHTPVLCSTANQVMVHGVSVSQDNVDDILHYTREQLRSFQHALSFSFIKFLDQINAKRAEQNFFLEEEEDHHVSSLKTDDIMVSPEAGFVDMLRCGILALQMLPENSSAGIVVITDGLVGVPEAYFLESLLTQLRNSTISCSFLKVGPTLPIQQQFGHVPNVELMQFIATATFGGYFSSCPDLRDEDMGEPNVYHQAMYYWSFQKGLEGFCYDDLEDDPDNIGSPSWVHRRLYSHPLHGGGFGLEVLRKKHQEQIVQASLSGVLSVRLREGYTIKEVRFHKGMTEIEVKLVLPWRDYGKIEYIATACWPMEKNSVPTRVEIFVEGSYDFLHEITCSRGRKVNSPFRTANIKKFWQVLQHISQTDQLLAHLQSFDTNPLFHEVPESIRSGVPLFVLDPVNPVLNSQLSTRESTLSQFASLWKPVIMLDTNIWQKWVHSHRIGLVLEQDLPLPRYLHVPNSSGRFNVLQCRQALASLNQLLRTWGTFVLAENHSYIKFLSKETDKPPSFFCLLRVTTKAPYVILRLAFLGGTPSHLRRQEIQGLKFELAQLKFPQRYTQKSDKKSVLKVASGLGTEVERKAPLLREWSEINCCTVLCKPVEKILIRYEQKPEDMWLVEERPRGSVSPEGLAGAGSGRSGVKQINSKFNTLSHYMLHHRWVWSVQVASSVPVSLHTVGKMLQTLTKIRLQEGFHFAAANSGICNMVLEVDMMDKHFTPAVDSKQEESDDEHQTCVIQYIVFPPHSKTSRDSVSEEDMDEMETAEADGEVQIVTECWIEPQFGVCIKNTPERLHFDGLTRTELAKAFYPVDYECISSLTTFNHLIYLCQHATSGPCLGPDIIQSGTSSPPSTPGRRHVGGHAEDEASRLEPSITFIPFPFDLLTLLPRSQQAQLLFSTFVIGPGQSAEQEGLDPKGSNELLFSLLYQKFKEIHDKEIFISLEESNGFLDLLGKRQRDLQEHQFPFRYKGFGGAKERNSAEKDDGQEPDRSETADSGDTAPFHTANTTPVTTPRPDPSSHLNPSSSGTGKFLPSGSLHHNPTWKCFVKAMSVTHMILTFIPATYDDLLLLNEEEVKAGHGVNVDEKGAEKSGVDGDIVSDAGGRPNERPGSRTPSLAVTGGESACESMSEAPASPLIAGNDVDTLSLGVSSVAVSDGEKVSTTLITVTEASPCQSPERTIPQSREEDIKEWVKTSSPAVQPAVKGPLVIPVYVYDCFHESVTESLVNRWTFSLPPDIFEDLRFMSESESDHPPVTRARLSSFDREASTIEEKEKDEADYPRANWRMSLDRRSTESMSESPGDFKQHCHQITETFFSCFVSGLYESLRHNYFVDRHDIDAAISNICEETLPLEIDMTSFLLASCSHMQRLAAQARKELAAAYEDMGSKKPSVRFMEIVDIQSTSDEGEVTIVPEILQLPRRMVSLLPSIFADISCEFAEGLHKLVQEKFLSIINHWFQPVASMPDFFFYNPSAQQQNSMCDDIEDAGDTGGTSDGLGDNDGMDTDASVREMGDDDAADVILADFANRHPPELNASMESNMDGSMSDIDLNETHESEGQEVVPLFVHFTCTLKRRTEHHHHSVTTIPLCLGDILNSLEEPLLAVDFGDFRITLDINCLTLPGDSDMPVRGKPSLLRMLSNQSQQGSRRTSECENDDAQSVGASTDAGDNLQGDPIGHLPSSQHDAVMKFKEEVEWLLRDEVSSALRHMYPITADALEFVMQHVSNSFRSMRPSAIDGRVKLHFVYGSDRSMGLFVEEFERMSVPGYHLTKVNGYYFLTIDRAHANNIRHAQQLNTALAELSHEEITANSNGSSPKAVDASKLFPSIEERSHSLPNILPSADSDPDQKTTEGAGGSVGSPETGGSSDENRPRSCSDAKFMKAQQNGERRPPRPRFEQSASLIADGRVESVDPSLRKSFSFAGLQGQVTVAPGPTTSTEVQSGQFASSKISPSYLSGVRSRHFSAPSGQGTPQSRASTLPQTPVGSSHCSATSDVGFEGDISDADMDDITSLSDAGLSYPQLPKFWLILQIQHDRVELFYHARDSMTGEAEPSIQLLSRMNKTISDISCKVNKQLLLKELYETRMCNALLVPEADEDVHWTDRRTISGRSVPDAQEDVDDEDDSNNSEDRGYLAAAMKFDPGYFACDCVWRKIFSLHPRLKAGTQRGGMSRGILGLRSILNKFSVNNRKNMFVIKEVTSGHVFYVRLKELNSGEPFDQGAELESSLSELSMQTLKLDSAKMDPETRSEGDAVSLASGLSRLGSRLEDVVELTVHGIEEAGKEIQEDLMKLLQNKLDDSVLDVISVMLSRNPQCKLRPEDVQFIQCPGQDATETLLLTIPSHAMMYLSALLFYLRQNLLQFLHTPNYSDDSPDSHFQDCVLGRWKPIPSDQVYLYISPQAGGRKGMACVSCSLVDGCGYPVRLLSCPRPTRLSSSNVPNINEFYDMVETSIHQASPTSWGPGPTALIQFRIWQRGAVDLRQLCERLMGAVSHALCDIIMEYTLLAAPICTVPRNLHDVKVLPVTSLPSSPVTVKKEPEHKPPLTRKMSESMRITMRPVPQSASPFQSVRDTSSRSKVTSPGPESSQSFDWSQVQAQASFAEGPPRTSIPSVSTNMYSPASIGGSEQEIQELQELVTQYEKGEKGSLHPIFAASLEPWFHFCHKKTIPSVTKVQHNLQADFSVEYILHELQSAVHTISSKVTLRVFKVLHYANPASTPMSVQFFPCNTQLMGLENQMETAMDSVQSEVGSVKLLAIGRDYEQWSMTVQQESFDYQSSLPLPSAATLKAYQGSQKFMPLCQEGGKDVDRDIVGALAGMGQAYIPRQRLLFLVAYDKKLVVYMYNWASDVASMFEKTLVRVVQWHNARAHILTSILSQKMGLFHHNMFVDLTYTVDQNPYTQSINDVDNLIRYTAPPRDMQRRHNSVSTHSRTVNRMMNQYRPFDDTYKNMKPHKTMQRLFKWNDPVFKHGVQAQEIRSRYRRDVERVMKLQQLYFGWLQKNTANPPVSEDYIVLLKQAARLFHYCATPLLFCQNWRQRVVEQNTVGAEVNLPVPPPPPPSPEKETIKSRSRHSSGASISSGRTKRSDSQDTGRAKKGAEPPLTPGAAPEDKVRKPSAVNPADEGWHRDMCHSFLMQYCNYLTTEFGFVCLQLQPTLQKKGSGRNLSEESREDLQQRHPTINLQKTLTSGIILMELSLRGQYFFLKMFVIDYLQLGITTNSQMQLLFVDECLKYKDLIHVHSFAHDFHLRCVHNYLNGQQTLFQQGFHLSNFLSEFLTIYPVPPSFARNCVAQETVQIRELPCPGSQLFDYMRKQIRQFSMTVFRMIASEVQVEPDYYYVKGDEFALVQTHILQPSQDGSIIFEGPLRDYTDSQEVYNMALVVTQDTARSLVTTETQSMTMKFFVVLTRQRDCHPKRTLEKKFADFRSGILANYNPEEPGAAGETGTIDGDDKGTPVAVKQHLGIRREHTNYLGYTNVHQARLYALLNTQIQAGRDKIGEMVEMSKVKCRRDYLWQRMLVATGMDQKKKTKPADDAFTLDPAQSPLTFEEFEEMLEMVRHQPLNQIDSRLSVFANMPTNWYSGLLPVLTMRFGTSCRCISNLDGTVHHTVILNHNWMDMLVLLSVDQMTGCTALSQVTREPYVEGEQGEAGDVPVAASLLRSQMHALIEDFVSACCFHLWTSIL